MKKIICSIVCVVLVLSLCFTANAEAGAIITGDSSVTVGDEITFTVSVSGCTDVSSVAVALTYDSGFELVSTTWLKDGGLKTFDTTKNKGSLGMLSSPDINGDLFKVVLKAVSASATAQNVSVNVIGKKGSSEIINVTPSKSVTINCATHSYGSYTNKDDNNHVHTCTACGHEETAAHTWNSGEVTKTANCKEKGVKTYTCTVCGATKTEDIPKTTEHSWDSGVVTTEPKCEEKGVKTYTCTVCQETKTEDINPLGHDFATYVSNNDATCESDGTETAKCTRCTKTDTRVVSGSALGHNYGEWEVTKPAKCEEAGEKTRVCQNDPTHKETQKIDATGHTWGEWVVIAELGCETDGEKTRECSACHKIETEKTPATGHTLEDKYTYDSGSHWKVCTTCQFAIGSEPHDFEEKVLEEATTEKAGKKAQVCKVCGYYNEDKVEEIPKLIAYDVAQSEGKTESEVAVYDGTDAKSVGYTAKFAKSKFKGVKVNGEEVDKSNYDVEEVDGETTKVTFKDEYLKKLGNGNYAITLVADDGISTTTMTVKNSTANAPATTDTATTGTTDTNKSGVKSDKTNNSDIFVILTALMALMGVGIFAGTYRKNKER